MNHIPSRRYEIARQNYLTAFSEYKEAREVIRQKTLRAHNIETEVRETHQEIKRLEAELLNCIGTGEEQVAARALREAQGRHADASLIHGLAKSRGYDPSKDNPEYTKKVELMSGASAQFMNEIIREELEDLPNGFRETLLRAYCIFSGADPSRWGRFFELHLDIGVPGANKVEFLSNLRSEILASHGFETK